jgi:hypothetical protein
MPRVSLTALIRSSTLTTSGSYFTTASLFCNDTLASFTPFTDSSADCTVAAQEPQVMPLISNVTVSSLAGASEANPAGTRSPVIRTPTIKSALLFISITSRVKWITEDYKNSTPRSYFHSQILELQFPFSSTSNSNMAATPFKRPNF